ncbi:15116_t:CDS:2 [Dentiscutata heterogama]|uniref:15116_t:CDS:1 n=1 Tax=Dentiscutata heterogama TaxID=1316150 RepID=A0ACA9JXJ3_9GLOM|nr:15116_t:CDS:2 [Dentiscutata heterogama]
MSSGYEDCKCGKPRTDNKWCQSCSSDFFKKQFGKWTSGNEAVDKFIQNIQLVAKSSDQVLEWVSFEKEIFEVEHLAVGGYGTVYKAKWRSGPIKYYDVSTQVLFRSDKLGGTDIILKGLKDSKDVNEEFFEEIKNQMTSFVTLGYIIKCYGVTKCPYSDNYMMIMEYKEDGSLRNYLDKNFRCLKWSQKLELLYTISEGRPPIYRNITPKIIIDLIDSCWDENPKYRPKAIDLRNKLSKYKRTCIEIDENQNFEITPTEAPLNYKTSEQASYISRLLPTCKINQ